MVTSNISYKQFSSKYQKMRSILIYHVNKLLSLLCILFAFRLICIEISFICTLILLYSHLMVEIESSIIT